jgi:putative YphP/YqiW family bacilliredoxin
MSTERREPLAVAPGGNAVNVRPTMYDERFVMPMRRELTELGFEELRTAEAVDSTLPAMNGTSLVVVNSICGCAARNARPAVRAAMQHQVRPANLFTVFAGQDPDATARARSYFTGYPPSSPSIALLRDGKLVWMLERWQIEGRQVEAIADDLVAAFDTHCSPPGTA